jgi:nondiscriminating glutamyl-tRNA synthetase
MSVRVRFAPSPTGPLHIGGVRTALYNYLFARKHGGTFILRIEDTDQVRYVEGAEDYIMKALQWLGLSPDESPQKGGAFAPYRQSDRREIYKKYVQQLLDSGAAYYAFDTSEALEQARHLDPTFKYNFLVREKMDNSLTISPEETQRRLAASEPYVIRLKIPRDELVVFEDLVRGRVSFHTDELDDKVLMKGDGLPTYHLANVVDDYLMQITHVIRGEEWLPSTPLHVLLYRAFGWENVMPKFSHLPLILKPSPDTYIRKDNMDALAARFVEEFLKKSPEFAGNEPLEPFVKSILQDKNGLAAKLKVGKKDSPEKVALKEFLKSTMFGKLSKRDGDRLGFPVFPLSWDGGSGVAPFKGFDEFGFLPAALVNFLAFVGWNPGDEQELFSLDELVAAFDLERVSKSGARFNFDKARWYNQQYLRTQTGAVLAELVAPIAEAKGYKVSRDFLERYCEMMKERAELLPDLIENGYYCFEPIRTFDEKNIKKRWKPELQNDFSDLIKIIETTENFEAANLETIAKQFIEVRELSIGAIFPLLRLAISGTMQGPEIFEIMELLGKTETINRLKTFYEMVGNG